MFISFLNDDYLVEQEDLFDRVNITLQITDNKLARKAVNR